MPTCTGTGWLHATEGVFDEEASTPSADDVGADPEGTAEGLVGQYFGLAIPSFSTGLITGGGISIDPDDPSQFIIDTGTGQVVEPSDNGAYMFFPCRWDRKSVPAMIGTGPRHPVYISMDRTGAVYQQVSPIAQGDLFSRIVVGLISVAPSTGRVVATYSIPFSIQSPSTRMIQFFRALGMFNESGNVYGPHGADLKLSRTAGTVFRVGDNFANDPRLPDLPNTDAEPVETFFRVRHDAGLWAYGPSQVDTIDPDHWDNLTSLQTVPTGKWTIQPVFYSKAVRFIQYGQKVYDTAEAALDGIAESIQTHPALTPADFLVRAFIVVQQGATSLRPEDGQAHFRDAGKFGLGSTSAGAGGGGGEANTASNINTRGVGMFVQKSGVDLQFAGIESDDPLVSVTYDSEARTIQLSTNIYTGTEENPDLPDGSIYFRYE